jgi:hypothetical protein
LPGLGRRRAASLPDFPHLFVKGILPDLESSFSGTGKGGWRVLAVFFDVAPRIFN